MMGVPMKAGERVGAPGRAGTVALLVYVLFLSCLFCMGCGSPLVPPEGLLNTPSHRVISGFRLAQKRHLKDARREFEMAIAQAEEYSPAYRGLGLVYGLERDFEQAFKAMLKAEAFAVGREEKALSLVGFMGLHFMTRQEAWLQEVERDFTRYRAIGRQLPEAYYQMGVAYRVAGHYAQAVAAFDQVLAWNRRLVEESREQLRIVEALRTEEKKAPGKGMPLIDSSMRRDLAGLFYPGELEETHP